MRLAIVGSRTFNNYRILCKHVDKYKGITEIISGGASGADSLAAHYAKEHNLKLTEHLPDWSKYGKAAGFKRNRKIIEGADKVIAFWDGKSKGTILSINLAESMEKPLKIVLKW